MSKAIVSAKFNREFSNVRLVASTSQDLSNPVYSPYMNTKNNVAKLVINGLPPNTQYYYGIEIGGVLQTGNRGMFKTFPEPGQPANFTCAFASCANTGSTSTVFDHIRNVNPLFFVHMGDFHYQDINVNDISLFRNAYDLVFSSPGQHKLYSEIPTAYIFDDHDYYSNDGNKNSPSRPAAQLAYRERVPHYNLVAGNEGANPIYQSFVVGRVRFIMTDMRSMKESSELADNEAKTMMGETQIQWFFNELVKPEPFKIWVNSVSFIGTREEGTAPEDWRAYTTERKRIANFIKANNLEGKVAIISGDMHSLAIDDGTNSDYADGGGAKIPVFQAAPLERPSSVKGGPWTIGPFTANGQFGIMNVVDDGVNPITFEWIGRSGSNVVATWTGTVNDGVDREPPIVTVNPIGGTFTQPQQVALTTNKASNIYYTLDGTEPTKQSTLYTEAVTIDSSKTLKYFAESMTGYSSEVETQAYVINFIPLKILRMSGTGSYLRTPSLVINKVELTFMSEDTDSTKTKYYLDFRTGIGSTWVRRNTGTALTEAFSGTGGTMYVDDIAVLSGTNFIQENVKSKMVYSITNASTPTALTILGSNTGTAAETTKGIIYDVKLFNGTTLVAHYDISKGNLQDQSGNGNHITTAVGHTWDTEGGYPIVTATPSGGSYDQALSVTLQSNKAGNIYYTTDGSTPTQQSLLYSGPIQITVDTALKFVAFDTNGLSSGVSTEVYSITPVTRTVASLDTGYLQTPAITFTEVVMQMAQDDADFVDFKYLLDFRLALASTWVRRSTGTGTISFSGTGATLYIDGNQVSSGGTALVNGLKQTIRFVLGSASTTEVLIFGSTVTGSNGYTEREMLKGKIYDIKFYNAGTLVAHYDTATGTLQDQSGNGNHIATFAGITWIED